MQSIVIYNSTALDGLAAKYAAHTYFKEQGIVDVHYVKGRFGKPIPLLTEHLSKEVDLYILDFSYPLEVLEDLHAKVNKLAVIDHLDSAEKNLTNPAYSIFDKTQSGCVLAWKYFHRDKPVPELLLRVQDRDLWTTRTYEDTNEVIAGLKGFPNHHEMVLWETLCDDKQWVARLHDEITLRGRINLQQNRAGVESYTNPENNKVKIITYEGFLAGLFCTTTQVSEIGNAVCLELPVQISISYFVNNEGEFVFSFRSAETFTTVDVEVLAKKLGGGGRPQAAGVTLPFAEGAALLAKLYETTPTAQALLPVGRRMGQYYSEAIDDTGCKEK